MLELTPEGVHQYGGTARPVGEPCHLGGRQLGGERHCDVAVQGGDRCRVTWVDPTDATLRETDVDCSADDDTPLGPSDDLRIKAHTGLLTGTAVSHEGPTTYGLRFWVPGLGTALALLGLVLVQRRARG